MFQCCLLFNEPVCSISNRLAPYDFWDSVHASTDIVGSQGFLHHGSMRQRPAPNCVIVLPLVITAALLLLSPHVPFAERSHLGAQAGIGGDGNLHSVGLEMLKHKQGKHRHEFEYVWHQASHELLNTVNEMN